MKKEIGFQTTVTYLFWDNYYTYVVRGPTRRDALLNIYLLRYESSLTACNILPVFGPHNWVLLEIELDEFCWVTKVERIVPLCYKTYI